MNKQYYYLVAHLQDDELLTVDKIFLQESQAVRWGRRNATINKDYTYILYRQQILTNATLEWHKILYPFKNN